MSKEEILARYLNIVSFGNGAAGVAAAARTYFNTTADQLTVPQAALLAGMVRSTTATDPVTNPEAARERRNVVIRQMREQQMIDETQMQAALAEPLGVVTPAGHPAGRLHRRRGRRVLLQVRRRVPAGGRVSPASSSTGAATRSPPRWTATCWTRCGPRCWPRCRRTQPNVANNMAVVAPGADKHRVLAMASSRGRSGWTPAKEETSYGLPYQPVPLGAGSVYKIFTAATAMEKGLGINYQLAVPPSGYASPIYIDGGGRPVAGGQRRRLPGAAVADRRAGAVAEHGVHQAGGVHRGPGRGGHGGPAGDEVAGLDPVRRPGRAAHRPVDRRGRPRRRSRPRSPWV